MANGFMVYFKSGTCDLDAAVRVLKGHGLTVRQYPESITVSRPGSPSFEIGIATETWVNEEATEIGADTDHAAALRGCDARFEVGFDSLDEVLDEINTMMEVQGALQEASNGILFLPWNGTLMG